jgi:formylglycine-generating enzyme required for sulfatase activity
MSEYDLFVSYNSVDRDMVIQVLDQLRAVPEPLNTFFDRESLTPGKLWFDELQSAMCRSRAVAVFFGRSGLGRWQKLEVILALDQQAALDSAGKDFRVIPVILPGADLNLVPRFLLLNSFADLRSVDFTEALQAIVRTVRSRQDASASERLLSTLPVRSELRNPYRGLNYFREEDAPLFFGREAISRKLLNKVKSCSLVALVGNSGNGKSSVVCAGLVPLLRREHPPAPTWEVIICIPVKDHQNPFHNLANAFLESWDYAPDEAVKARPHIEDTIRTTSSIADCISQTLKYSKNAEKVLLVIDQFEELVTSEEYQHDFIPFTELLLNATEIERCTVLLVIRGDYYGSVIKPHQGLADAIAEGLVNLAQMEQEQLWEVINKPATIGGTKFEPGLAHLVIKDVEKEPGNLALLEYALTELWNHQKDGWLTHDAYNNVVGGLEGAIQKKADETLESRAVPSRNLALRALIRLVRVSPVEEEGGDTRQRVFLLDFTQAERACLEPFVKARLLITSGPTEAPVHGPLESCNTAYRKGDEATIEVAHEALIRHWATLRTALKEKREFLSWRQSIRREFEDWKRQARTYQYRNKHVAEDLLLQGRDLKLGLEWLRKLPLEFSEEERIFVLASQRRVTLKKYLVLNVTSAAFALVISVSGFLIWAEQQGYGPGLASVAILTRAGMRMLPPEPKMQMLEPSNFVMGALENDKNARDDERPPHLVILQKRFAMGIYEVTFEEYDAFVESTGSRRPQDSNWGRGKHPVVDVNWDDAVAYAKWLSFMTGKSFRLPTESEWEYASRAKSQTVYPWGNEILQDGKVWANCASCGDVSSEGKSLPVGSFPSNHFGLHDMAGNAAEWVADCMHKNYIAAPIDGAAWLDAEYGDCKQRMIRGGSWNFNPLDLRSSYRSKNYPDFRNHDLGFRLVQDFENEHTSIVGSIRRILKRIFLDTLISDSLCTAGERRT